MKQADRIAVCLYGRFNNRFSDSAGTSGADYIRRKFLDRYDCDLYIFSTDLQSSDAINEEYRSVSKRLVIEEAPDFAGLLLANGVQEGDFLPIEGFRTASNTLSFLYNRMRSLGLLADQITDGSVHYKSAVCCRFDSAQIDKHNGYQPFRVSEINFNPNRDMKYLYSAMWNQLNAGFADQWFYSAPKTLLRLMGMYDAVLQNLKKGSSYHTMITKGIPDSNAENPFSNEMLLPVEQKSSNLVSIDWERAVDNHLLHKWFLMEQNLYDGCRFTSDIPGAAHVLYTHTDYADVWPMYFGQEVKHFSGFEKNYILVNRRSDKIPVHYEQIVYDENVPYVDRLISGIEKIHESVIFFDHEDMIVTGTPKTDTLLAYVDLVKTNSRAHRKGSNLDFVRLVRGGKSFSLPYRKAPHLNFLLRKSPWIFSIQPSFWNRERLLELLYEHQGQPIWSFEQAAQATSRRLKMRGAFVSKRGRKRGVAHWDNAVYPYIATAIVKGKWNTLEYGLELNALFKEYGIDPMIRGEMN